MELKNEKLLENYYKRKKRGVWRFIKALSHSHVILRQRKRENAIENEFFARKTIIKYK